jgi:N-acetylglucosaminyldiphosphoundecaprenol N-acetyl-beta-D-mannosaminyltransferase
MIRLKNIEIVLNKDELQNIPEGKTLINTINAHSYNVARKDKLFAEALTKGDYLIPDGMSVVKACKWLHAKSQPKERIAGADLFEFEMEKLNKKGGTVMFMGSSEKTLAKVVVQATKVYPNLKVVTYSPPYKPEFNDEDNKAIVNAINTANPDLLWIGMTAPKQEKWTYSYWNELSIHCHVGTIGAVFDFFAGNTKRAPLWWQHHGLEWLYRLIKEPRRMWRRYLVGNLLFLWYIAGEKFGV